MPPPKSLRANDSEMTALRRSAANGALSPSAIGQVKMRKKVESASSTSAKILSPLLPTSISSVPEATEVAASISG